MSIVRTGNRINPADFFRATAAAESAKRMMSHGNPLIGADKRANASTHCGSCGRWHRPGTVCFNATKSIQETMIQEGRRVTPGTLHSENLLSYQPKPKEEKEHHELAEDFKDGSQHLQKQEASYLDSLRAWQTKYGNQ